MNKAKRWRKAKWFRTKEKSRRKAQIKKWNGSSVAAERKGRGTATRASASTERRGTARQQKSYEKDNICYETIIGIGVVEIDTQRIACKLANRKDSSATRIGILNPIYKRDTRNFAKQMSCLTIFAESPLTCDQANARSTSSSHILS